MSIDLTSKSSGLSNGLHLTVKKFFLRLKNLRVSEHTWFVRKAWAMWTEKSTHNPVDTMTRTLETTSMVRPQKCMQPITSTCNKSGVTINRYTILPLNCQHSIKLLHLDSTIWMKKKRVWYSTTRGLVTYYSGEPVLNYLREKILLMGFDNFLLP